MPQIGPDLTGGLRLSKAEARLCCSWKVSMLITLEHRMMAKILLQGKEDQVSFNYLMVCISNELMSMVWAGG